MKVATENIYELLFELEIRIVERRLRIEQIERLVNGDDE